jgi:putative ABC transport system ATP-binding protein/lipoprotein-releasing system ATP-binding protein
MVKMPTDRQDAVEIVQSNRILVEAHNAGRTYSGQTPVVALASATCSVMLGDRIAITGPSGSGKSTLLYLMGGLETVTSGSLIWPALGPIQGLRPAKVAFVFQVPSLLVALTVIENIELPLLLDNVDKKIARQAALAALERLDLSGIADNLPEELSGGQAQRVAMARALASQSKLILADEPTGQLDHPTAQHLFDILLAAIDGTDTALVVATHDQAVANRLHTIWHMHHGILEINSKC